MTQQKQWAAVVNRDRTADGSFVFAVRTTRIYCRPSCPARRPNRRNVSFYPLPEAAEAAGYRACRRCRPADLNYRHPQAALVREVCELVEREESLTLTEIAERVGRSPSYVQRTVRNTLGISPREYRNARRRSRFRDQLRGGRGVTAAQYEAGFASSSRLYEGADRFLGMTPARYRRGGEGVEIRFGFGRTTLGHVLVASTDRGVCAVRIGSRRDTLEKQLRDEFSRASLQREDAFVETALTRIMEAIDRDGPTPDLPLDLQATAFQAKVWRALLEIPRGETRTYLQIARQVGAPRAVRAVANACAANPVAVAIPCHRVVRTDGSPGGYRWGVERKEALLGRESVAGP